MLIIKVPGINNHNKTNGCRNAGNAIIKQLRSIKSNEKNIPILQEIFDFEEIHVNNENLEEQESLIYKNALKTYQSQNKAIFLGGDHSISYPLTKAFLEYSKQQNTKPFLIIFDAHPDCIPIRNKKTPTNEQWLRALIENENFPKENVLLIGARNSDPQETSFLQKNNIKQISINQLNENLHDSIDIIMEQTQKHNLYISINPNTIDPAFAPSTLHKEPGGLTSRQMIYICSRLSLLKNLKALDIVEINSEEDSLKHADITTKLAAKILAEFL